MIKEENRPSSQRGADTSKKAYKTPRLVKFGDVAKLTAGTSGSHTDKGHGSNDHGNG